MSMPWRASDTVTLREEFVLKAMSPTVDFKALCEEFGVSRKTGYKWMMRFKQGGLPALRNTSRRPHGSSTAMKEATVCELVRIKGSVPKRWGPKKVLALYVQLHGAREAPSLSSVKRVLDRAGFVQRRRRFRSGEPERVQEGIVATRPNEQWTVDFKGWWKTRDGARCEPLTVRDGFSRFLLDLRAMESTAEHAVRPAFERLFERYGLPESIRSDNGTPFASHQAPLGLSRLSSWWVSLGIRLDRIDPGRPDQNGTHERIHRDIRAELQLTPSDGVEASQALFDQWRHEFNWIRPHEALGMQVPGKIYVPSQTVYEPGHLDLNYPPDWMERRVTPNGTIYLQNHPILVSQAVSGFTVGLQPTADQLAVWFDYLRLGHIDLHTFRFVPVVRPPFLGH
jgi:putative transposase